MKTLQLIATRQLQCVEVPSPTQLAPNEVLVRVKAVGICGSDMHYYRGEDVGLAQLPFPVVMGHEFAGQVAAVGAQVTQLQVGERVAVEPAIACEHCEACLTGHPHVCPQVRFVGAPPLPGALQEWLVHPAHLVFKLPASLSYVQGALLEPLGVALHAVNIGAVRIADTVAVLGCGPIGLLIVQLARLAGAQAIYATDVLDYRLRMAEHCGATVTINPTRADPAQTVLQATQGRGVDVVFDAAGATTTPDEAAAMAKPLGTVVMVALCTHDQMNFRAAPTRRKGLTIKVSRRMNQPYPRTIALLSRRMVEVESLVTHTFPLERGAEAFRLLDTYEDDIVKAMIVLEWEL